MSKKIILKNKQKKPSIKATDITETLVEASILNNDKIKEKERARRIELSHVVTSLRKAIKKAEANGDYELVKLLNDRLDLIINILEGKEESDPDAERPGTKSEGPAGGDSESEDESSSEGGDDEESDEETDSDGSEDNEDNDDGEDTEDTEDTEDAEDAEGSSGGKSGKGKKSGKTGKGGKGKKGGKGGKGSSRDPFAYRKKRYSVMGIPLPAGGIPKPGSPSDYDLMCEILQDLTGDAKNGAIKALEDALEIKTESLSQADAFLFRRSNKWLSESIMLKEARNLGSWSDDEFNDLIDSTLELIDKVNPTRRASAEEENQRLAELDKDINSKLTKDDLDIEDQANVSRDSTKGNRSEINRITTSQYGSFDKLQLSIYRAMKDQVELYEEEEDTFSAIDRRFEDDPTIVIKGKRLEDKEKEGPPNIYCYVDCSGSWGENDILMGKRLLATLNEFKKKGEITVEIWYHSAIFTQDYKAARSQGHTENFDAVLNHIKTVGAKNVVILADHDIDYSTSRDGKATRIVVPGCVWWCWKNGSIATQCAETVKGKKLNATYTFKGGSY